MTTLLEQLELTNPNELDAFSVLIFDAVRQRLVDVAGVVENFIGWDMLYAIKSIDTILSQRHPETYCEDRRWLLRAHALTRGDDSRYA